MPLPSQRNRQVFFIPEIYTVRAQMIKCSVLPAPKKMIKSKSIARIVGPTLTVMVISEMKVWNPDLYNSQIAPLVYLSGVLIFIAGLSIVSTHNIWVVDWRICLTCIGWLAVILGLIRMFFPQYCLQSFQNGLSASIIEILLILTGIFLTYKAYWSEKN